MTPAAEEKDAEPSILSGALCPNMPTAESQFEDVRSVVKPLPPASAETSILILTEGEQTELNYLKGFVEHYRLPAKRIQIVHPSGTDPATLVREGMLRLNEQQAKRRLGELPDGATECWIVCDRDSVPSDAWREAMMRAWLVPDLHLALSNPCIELWFLHHFSARRDAYQSIGAQVGGPEVTKWCAGGLYYEQTIVSYAYKSTQALCLEELKRIRPGYKKNSPNLYQKLCPHEAEAFARDFPLEKQMGAGVWSTLPALLVRLLSLAYTETEIGFLLQGLGVEEARLRALSQEKAEAEAALRVLKAQQAQQAQQAAESEALPAASDASEAVEFSFEFEVDVAAQASSGEPRVSISREEPAPLPSLGREGFLRSLRERGAHP